MADDIWTDEELMAAAVAYFKMLQLELDGIDYSKTEYRRELQRGALSGRNDSSIEFRMQNISAVLEGIGQPCIAGYKSAKNVGAGITSRLIALMQKEGLLQGSIQSVHKLQDLIDSPDQIQGVKATFSKLTSYVLCFGGRGDPSNLKSYYSMPARAANKAQTQPYIISIGGGANVEPGLSGRILNVSRLSLVYGPTNLLISDPKEIARLSQWPVSIALKDVWVFEDTPHLVSDLGFADRTILAGAQDGIIRPEQALSDLWNALKDCKIVLANLPPGANFYEPGHPTLVGSVLPTIPAAISAKEGKGVWRKQRQLERNPLLARAAKNLNREKYGKIKCEACEFKNEDSGLFDAHHPTPLAVGARVTLATHLQILCPTCHRRAHRKSRLIPYSLEELRDWWKQGRP